MFDRNKKVDGKFTKQELKEIQNISNRLEIGEKVLEIAKQVSRRPGGTISGIGANIYFVTSLRIIIYNPSLFGIRKDIETYSFDSIVDVRLQKGVFSSTISLIIPGLTELGKERVPILGKTSGLLSGIPKEKGEIFVNTIQEKLKELKSKESKPENNISDDPLKILKNRYAKGEITKEEFEEIKKDLE